MAIIIRKNKAATMNANVAPLTLANVMTFSAAFNTDSSIKNPIYIKIGVDGNATNEDGSALGLLDLGVQGEHKVK